MGTIVSGTTIERIVRTVLFAALVCGFSAFSFKDGYYSYPKENVLAVLSSLGAEQSESLPIIDNGLTAESVQGLGIRPRAWVEEVVTAIGGEPYKHEDDLYFFGYGGHLRLETRAGRVTKVHPWTSGPKHDATSLLFQKLMGFVLAPLGLVFILQLIRVVTTRVVLSDDGLKVRGKPMIPFSAMKGFVADKYRKKGWVELEYELNGHQGSVRLDNYVVKEFRSIIQAVCEKTDIESPLPPKQDERK